MSAVPVPAPLTTDQVVAMYDSVEASEDLTAAHAECDRVSHTFNNDDRGRVARALVAAASRVFVWRAPKCVDCGG